MQGPAVAVMGDHYIESTVKRKKGYTGKPYAPLYSHGGGGKVKSVMKELFKRVGKQVGVASRVLRNLLPSAIAFPHLSYNASEASP